VSRAFAWLLLRLRFVVIPAWIVAAVLVAHELPSIAGAAASPLGGLVPHGAHALEVEQREYDLFHSTVISRIAVVQRRAGGFRGGEERRVYDRAIAVDKKRVPLLRHISFALPITNAGGLFPSSREKDTTAITFLYFKPDVSVNAQLALAHTYANQARDDNLIGVTGSVPAREAEYHAIESTLPRLTIATVLLILLVLLVAYRAVAPPLITIGAAGIVYLVATHVLAWVAAKRGLQVPNEVEPVMIALLLGLVTDYSVFYLTGMRRRLEAGARGFDAAEETTRLFSPIILTAGLIVAAGGATLLAGRLPVFRAFGPGLALTVLICLAVSLTFIPAALGILGRLAFWPRLRLDDRPQQDDDRLGRLARLRATRPAALAVGLATAALLGGLAFGLTDTALGFTLIRGQPAGSQLRRAELAASVGFDRGIVAPTLVLLQGSNMNARRPQLVALERLLEQEPGVAGVVGPIEQRRFAKTPPVFVNAQGTAARLAVILKQEPLGSNGIAIYRRLAKSLPSLLDRAGLHGVHADFAGDTVLAAETIDAVRGDIERVAGAVLLANFLLLAIFLRGLLAPLYLLAASTLGLAATLGLTTIVFEHVLGHQDLTYYVPFAASVLLLSLGSDYNLFVVGRIWQETERRPLREAVAYAVPRASGTIAIAGLTLASSFALIALVPIRPMHELAFTMAAGILIDTFVVRSLLVPSLVVLFGRGRRRRASALQRLDAREDTSS
jgi:putative drug exporter of the RND superfamily